MKKKQKAYSIQLKQKAQRMYIEDGMTFKQIEAELKLVHNALTHWSKKDWFNKNERGKYGLKKTWKEIINEDNLLLEKKLNTKVIKVIKKDDHSQLNIYQENTSKSDQKSDQKKKKSDNIFNLFNNEKEEEKIEGKTLKLETIRDFYQNFKLNARQLIIAFNNKTNWMVEDRKIILKKKSLKKVIINTQSGKKFQ